MAGASAVRGKLVGLALLALLALGSGCHSVPEKEKQANYFGGDRRHWLSSAARYRKLLVEIDAVKGCEPTTYELATIRSFLTENVSKPDGITIKVDDIIPPEVAVNYSSDALALTYMGGPPDDDTAFLYLIFYRTKLNGLGVKAENPQTSWFPFPGAIFVDRSYGWFFDLCFRKTARPAILRHEIGHALGLAEKSDHAKNGHCTDDYCLMATSLWFSYGQLFHLRSPWMNLALCDQCRRDLLAYKTEATSPLHERYWHGYFLQEHDGFQILTRPGFVYATFGPLADLSWENVEKKRHEALADDPRAVTSYTVTNFDPERDPSALGRMIEIGGEIFPDMGKRIMERTAEMAEASLTTEPEVVRVATSDGLMAVAKKFPELLARLEAVRKKFTESATAEAAAAAVNAAAPGEKE